MDQPEILVDPEDQWLLDSYYFNIKQGYNTQYARCYIPGTGKATMMLHHCILGRPLHGLEIDHKNGNGLDNRRANIRVVSRSTNQHNSTIKGHRGVSKHGGGYRARITVNGEVTLIGQFNSASEASEAYKKYKEEYATIL